MADSLRLPMARASNKVQASFRVHEPKQQTGLFIRDLAGIIAEHDIHLLVPTCEEIFFIARFQEELGCEVFCDSFQKLEALHNKYSFTSMVGDCGVQVPETHWLESRQQLEAFLEHAPAWVFKPVYSRFAAFTRIGANAAQRRIFGRELCSYGVAWRGCLRAVACYHPLYRLHKSSGVYFEPVAHAGVQNFMARFVAKHGFHGQIGFDFIEAEDGSLHVIECNPRVTSGIHLFAAGDALALAFAAGGGACQLATAGPKMLAPVMLTYSLARAPWERGLRAFIKDYRRATDAGHCVGDGKPSYYRYLGVLEVLLRSLARGITPMEAATADLEWDGERL